MTRLDERITTHLAASRLGVTESLVRKWASRYGLVADIQGRYRFGDLVEIEWRTRQGKGARRKLTIATSGVTLAIRQQSVQKEPA